MDSLAAGKLAAKIVEQSGEGNQDNQVEDQ